MDSSSSSDSHSNLRLDLWGDPFGNNANRPTESEHGLQNRLYVDFHRELSPYLREADTLPEFDVESFPALAVQKSAAFEARIPTNSIDALDFYVNVASESLVTAFVLTQRHAGWRRVLSSSTHNADRSKFVNIENGTELVTVGISHLTTSRQFGLPAVVAAQRDGSWILRGTCPWVTGCSHADWFVVGATVDPSSRSEALFLLPKSRSGITSRRGFSMQALTNSDTGELQLDDVHAYHEELIHGPVTSVVERSNRPLTNIQPPSPQGSGPSVGGLHTSALAIGHASKAIRFLRDEAQRRSDLIPFVVEWVQRWNQARRDLLALASLSSQKTATEIRKESNDLAIQASHAALVAAKGTGFLASHPAGRWCRESLFFLVWSCPPAVATAHQNCLANLSSD